ncbi:transposase [Candidatus Latescibacterota bacterium]
MAPGTLDVEWVTEELIWVAPGSELKEMLDEALDLVRRRPEILTLIEADQETMALAKKKLRLADQRWVAALVPDFPQLRWEEEVALAAEPVLLETGRPRMPAEVVYVFFMLQGYLGSVTDRRARDQLLESRTLHRFLHGRGLGMPGWSTILEQVNAVSVATRNFILDAQLQMICEAGLDDFGQVVVDSTAVKANSTWPTDAGILLGLLQRAFRISQHLDRFGLANLPKHWVPFWLRKLGKLLFRISIEVGKPHAKRKRRKHYRRFLDSAQKVAEHLMSVAAERDPLQESAALPPSRRAQLERMWAQLQEDLVHAVAVSEYTEERIFQEKQRPSGDKMLSLADPSAAYIEKGNREAVIGYRPQVARSGQGFVCGLIVPEGNAADSTQLRPLLDEVEQRTGTRPTKLSADDGYVCAADRDQLLEEGLQVVSFSGAKGKKIISEADWDSPAYVEARRGRSAVESLIFVLKHGFDFGSLRRRGLDAVRAELLQKVIAHNFCRMVLVRARQQELAKRAA